jgi:hypothetical protein
MRDIPAATPAVLQQVIDASHHLAQVVMQLLRLLIRQQSQQATLYRHSYLAGILLLLPGDPRSLGHAWSSRLHRP